MAGNGCIFSFGFVKGWLREPSFKPGLPNSLKLSIRKNCGKLYTSSRVYCPKSEKVLGLDNKQFHQRWKPGSMGPEDGDWAQQLRHRNPQNISNPTQSKQ